MLYSRSEALHGILRDEKPTPVSYHHSFALILEFLDQVLALTLVSWDFD